MTREARTPALYAALGCLGYLLAALGAIVPELRAERGLPRAEAALYPSGFAVGLVVVGLTGHRLARRLGRHALPAALGSLVGGAAVLALSGGRLGGAAGALALGLGGAGLVQVVPATLRAIRDDATVAIGKANAVSSGASVVAPPLIGAAVAHGLGWRAAFALPPLLVAAVLLVRRPAARALAEPPDGEPGGRAPRPFRSRWTDLVLAVGVEFCMMFWAADFLHSVKGLGTGAATTASAAFVLGMAAGRAMVGPAVRYAGTPRRLLACAASLALAGFAAFWAAPPAPAVAGLGAVGLGVALLYPVVLAEALAAWPERPARAAARCALASGTAVGVPPLALGALADLAGLRAAYLIAPFLLTLFLVRALRRSVPPR
ncbi:MULTISPECIES: MFS transporter [Actinomadura]|uniref:MFS transporter n=1 Tax=Actinomadura yumaensis TaxID=111807 RepID=A0ABW2CY63_9ACTN|nr:MFS transporter [Actinomadura sp. J1-007]MWK36309.1 MFS transporter [Actinomadura sp. J1-007]